MKVGGPFNLQAYTRGVKAGMVIRGADVVCCLTKYLIEVVFLERTFYYNYSTV